MLSFTISSTVLIEQRDIAKVGWCSAPFPVARSIDGATRGDDLHLVDGDGASLCEAFTQQQLERLPLAWSEIVPLTRCRICDVLGA
jgi:hypothetical protein